jgi:23S rRNA pseudouridine1911/1915/1917 synthase
VAIAIVPEGLAGQRADAGAARLFGVARSRVEQAVQAGRVRQDGAVIAKSARLRAGALLEVELDEPRAVTVRPALAPGLSVVYDDADLVVVDKPAGLAAHPSLGWSGGSVLEHLLAGGYQLSGLGPPERQGIVSRLDVGTSGLMVVAKSDLAYTSLKRDFKQRAVRKVYHAVAQGYPVPAAASIELPIGHARTDEWKMAIDPAGRAAVTRYDTLETLVGAALLHLDLLTGRTHQIRVHLAAIRHPCVGDLLYGADPALAGRLGLDRQWLHAQELGFAHPRSGQPMAFSCGYPPDLAHALSQLRAPGQRNAGMTVDLSSLEGRQSDGDGPATV